MGGKKKERAKIPSKTAEIIDEVESIKYRAAALMKRDNAEITSEMTDAEIISVMDKYLDMAKKKLAEERLKKTEQSVLAEISRLQDVLKKLREDMENL